MPKLWEAILALAGLSIWCALTTIVMGLIAVSLFPGVRDGWQSLLLLYSILIGGTFAGLVSAYLAVHWFTRDDAGPKSVKMEDAR